MAQSTTKLSGLFKTTSFIPKEYWMATLNSGAGWNLTVDLIFFFFSLLVSASHTNKAINVFNLKAIFSAALSEWNGQSIRIFNEGVFGEFACIGNRNWKRVEKQSRAHFHAKFDIAWLRAESANSDDDAAVKRIRNNKNKIKWNRENWFLMCVGDCEIRKRVEFRLKEFAWRLLFHLQHEHRIKNIHIHHRKVNGKSILLFFCVCSFSSNAYLTCYIWK